MQEISTKPKAIELFTEGYFGNTIDTWYEHEKWLLECDLKRLYVLRQYKRKLGGSGYCKYNLKPIEVCRELVKLRKEGCDMSSFIINEAMPDKEVLLQGEYMAGPSTLFYSTEVMHMRPALEAGGKHAYGPHADLIVKSGMCDRGYEKFCELKDRYPKSVIEFSVYNVPVGTKHWNTMLWEVRNY